MTVTGDHVLQSIGLLEKAPALEVGLHLVLSGGERPLTKATGLVDRVGRFHALSGLALRAWARKLDRGAVLAEIAAQAEMFLKLVGRRPAYVDCHHHAHQFPTVRDALVEAVRAGLLPAMTRLTLEPLEMSAVASGGAVRARRLVARRFGAGARGVFAEAGLTVNQFYFGMLSKVDLACDFPWRGYFEHWPAEGVVEWVVHPGRVDATLAGRDTYVAERVKELEALTAEGSRAVWEIAGWRRATKSAALGG